MTKGTKVKPTKKKLGKDEIDAALIIYQFPSGFTTREITDRFDLPEDHIRRGVSILRYMDLVKSTKLELITTPETEQIHTRVEPVYYINDNSLEKERLERVIKNNFRVEFLRFIHKEHNLWPHKVINNE